MDGFYGCGRDAAGCAPLGVPLSIAPKRLKHLRTCTHSCMHASMHACTCAQVRVCRRERTPLCAELLRMQAYW